MSDIVAEKIYASEGHDNGGVQMVFSRGELVSTLTFVCVHNKEKHTLKPQCKDMVITSFNS
jgi:hypothetical protein